jgi:fatty acid amide hydrolase
MTNTPTPYLAPQDDPVLSASATQLARQLACGELTSVELVEKYIERAIAVQTPLNALAVPLFDQARQQAKEADRQYLRGERLGPLHGLPITVKECYHVAGTASSLGLSRFADEIFPEDGPLVRRLREAGAIIVGKTNVPQAMLLHETENPLFGRTNNPWNLARSPGGSSGGEAALIAAGGSTLGLANDLGGSIRIPAHFCGICGIKPTAGRLTNAGCRNNLSGLKIIATQSGVLARTVSDLEIMSRALCTRVGDEPQYADETSDPLPRALPRDIGRLRIGVLEDDGTIRPAPAIRRAVREAANELSSLGVAVEPFPAIQTATMLELYLGLLGADGARALNELIRGGPVDRRIARLASIGKLRPAARKMLAGIARASGQQTASMMLRATGQKSAAELVTIAERAAAYRHDFTNAMDQLALDGVILPPHALPALTHGASLHLPLAASYSFLANLIGFPAGVVPWTRVGADEESDRPRSLDATQRTATNVERGSAGLPVGVQVIGRPWREDIVLAIMAALEAAAPLPVWSRPEIRPTHAT